MDLRGRGLPGAAALVKQVALVHAIVFVPALLLRAWVRGRTRPRRWVRGLLDVLAFGLGVSADRGGRGDDRRWPAARGGRRTRTSSSRPGAGDRHAARAERPVAGVRWLTGNADPEGPTSLAVRRDRLPGLVGDRELAALAGLGAGAGLPGLRQADRCAATPGRRLDASRPGSRSPCPASTGSITTCCRSPGVAIAVAVLWPTRLAAGSRSSDPVGGRRARPAEAGRRGRARRSP